MVPEIILDTVQVILHIDIYLDQALAYAGLWIYGLLFLIVFCETGLVVMPFLPGDSLLFATGALMASENSPLSPVLLGGTFIVASIMGDATNYFIGKRFGTKVKGWKNTWYFKRAYIDSAQHFYERHGGKTIVLARFMPLVRTFAPFVAGMGKMNYQRFSLFNVSGAFLWVVIFLTAGFLFGGIPVVKANFSLVVFAIVLISLSPPIVHFLYRRLLVFRTKT